MNFNNFNFQDAELKSDFKTFDNGEYPVCVEICQVDDSNSPEITMKIKLKFLNGKYEGDFIYDNLLLNSSDPKNWRLGQAKKRMSDFNNFLPNTLNSAEDLIDKCFMIVIKNTIKDEKTYCNISYYKKYDSNFISNSDVESIQDTAIPF
tara:strand:+ start:1290 stop:1736 length:447 start_codon:yes stop_codon:yes gene_type:complete